MFREFPIKIPLYKQKSSKHTYTSATGAIRLENDFVLNLVGELLRQYAYYSQFKQNLNVRWRTGWQWCWWRRQKETQTVHRRNLSTNLFVYCRLSFGFVIGHSQKLAWLHCANVWENVWILLFWSLALAALFWLNTISKMSNGHSGIQTHVHTVECWDNQTEYQKNRKVKMMKSRRMTQNQNLKKTKPNQNQ